MKPLHYSLILILSLLIGVASIAHSQTVTITETFDSAAGEGRFKVTVEGTLVYAFAVGNNTANDTMTDRPHWGTDPVLKTDWNYYLFLFDLPIDLLFQTVFGEGVEQAVAFWDKGFENIFNPGPLNAMGPSETDDSFTWTGLSPGSKFIAVTDTDLGYILGTVPLVSKEPSFTGIFRNGWWYLDSNGTSGWNAGDTKIKFGIAGDIPVTGDWDADGYTDMGIYRDGWWYLDSNGTSGWNAGDTKIKFGITGDIAVTGDWNADGYADMGIYRNGWWYLDSNGSPGWNAGDTKIKFGLAGDIPVTGDWNADGYTDMGIYRNGWWYLDSNGSPGWNAGDTKIRFGTAGDIPVTGDWDADGYTDMGIYRNGWWYLDSNGSPGWNAGDTKIKLGIEGDIPLSGTW